MKNLPLSSAVNLLLLLVILISSCSKQNPDELIGEWLRIDGTYTIEILEVLEKGKLEAKYFNPNSINVGKAGWQIKDDQLELYVELQDENYPGSVYQLKYIKESDKLSGTYYQAVSKQTYEVSFSRINKIN